MKYTPSEKDEIFALNDELQIQIDSLRNDLVHTKKSSTYTFNPNYLTDYKGYTLGISPTEIDRLFAFRKQGRFVNSAEEFQRVTGISDSLLEAVAPQFKFPDWIKNKGTKKSFGPKDQVFPKKQLQDLNSATAEDLMQIYGVGEKLSQRIVKFRDRLGGFLVKEQLYDVYGLEPQVVHRAFERFQVLQSPEITKIKINSATEAELAEFVYIGARKAKAIIQHREQFGSIKSLNELTKMFNVSSERIDRIGLYLSFEE